MASVGTFGALGLHGPAKGTKVTTISQVIVGSAVVAGAGAVTVDSGQTANQLGPMILPTLRRTINPKSVGSDSVAIVGAQVRCQGEELEGGHATIYVDGVGVSAGAGTLIINDDTSVEIVNDTAEIPAFSNNTIDDRSGFKAYPGELVRDEYSKNRVLSRFRDAAQQEPRAYSSNSADGSPAPEQDDTFLSTNEVSRDDL